MRSSLPAMSTLSETACAALGKSWKFLVSTGKYDPWLEFFSGPMPRSPEDPTTAQNKLLCRLKVDPRTLRVAQGNAINSGDASFARLIGADGKALGDFKCTLRNGGGVIEWNTLEIRKGGPVTMFTSLNFYRLREEDAQAEDREEREAELERLRRWAKTGSIGGDEAE